MPSLTSNSQASTPLTLVARCSLRHEKTSRAHLDLCVAAEREKQVLESALVSEHYAVLRRRFSAWNDAVWNDKWTLASAPCDLCHLSVCPFWRSVEPVRGVPERVPDDPMASERQ